MKKNIQTIFIMTLSLFPALSLAALNGVEGLLLDFRLIIVQLVPVMVGLALIFFFWGMAQFILHAGDSKLREEGKQKMIWGVIALFVMISIAGILATLGSLFNIDSGGNLMGGILSR